VCEMSFDYRHATVHNAVVMSLSDYVCLGRVIPCLHSFFLWFVNLIGTACIVCGLWSRSMKEYSVHLSVCLSQHGPTAADPLQHV